jgi:hypothetical protein
MDLTEVRARTGLSPEWDRGFDDAFTELVCSDDELVRAEFDALIRASWRPPAPPAPAGGGGGPPAAGPPGHGPPERRSSEPNDSVPENEHPP